MYFVLLLLFIFVSLRFPPCCCNWMLVSTLSVKMFHFSNILGSPKAVKPTMKHRCIFSCGGGGGKWGSFIYSYSHLERRLRTEYVYIHTHAVTEFTVVQHMRLKVYLFCYRLSSSLPLLFSAVLRSNRKNIPQSQNQQLPIDCLHCLTLQSIGALHFSSIEM